jgi:hypothetical protein
MARVPGAITRAWVDAEFGPLEATCGPTWMLSGVGERVQSLAARHEPDASREGNGWETPPGAPSPARAGLVGRSERPRRQEPIRRTRARWPGRREAADPSVKLLNFALTPWLSNDSAIVLL